MKPLLIGYLNARGSSTPRMLRDAEAVLATFADVEGYALSHVFIEPDSRRPYLSPARTHRQRTSLRGQGYWCPNARGSGTRQPGPGTHAPQDRT